MSTTSSPFFTLPLTLRQEVYAHVLILSSRTSTSESDITLGLLLANRQIHEEASWIFYSRNLFTVVESNGTLNSITNFRQQCMVRLLAKNSAAKFPMHKMAMRLQFYTCDDTVHRADTSPVFVLARSALKDFKFHLFMDMFVATQNVLRASLYENYSYTSERLETRTLALFLGDSIAGPQFSGFLPHASISPREIRQLRGCVGGFNYAQLLDKLLYLGNLGANALNAENPNYDAACARYDVQIVWADALWTSHLRTFVDAPRDTNALFKLWHSTGHAMFSRIVAVWHQAQGSNVASTTSADRRPLWLKMRTYCEDAIETMNGSPMDSASVILVPRKPFRDEAVE